MLFKLVKSDGQLFNEGVIIQPFRDKKVKHSQGQKAIATWPGLNPDIRPLRQLRLPGVDDDETGPLCQGLDQTRVGMG